MTTATWRDLADQLTPGQVQHLSRREELTDVGYFRSFVSYTAADYDGQPLAERAFSTDGDDTLDSLPAKIRLLAQ